MLVQTLKQCLLAVAAVVVLCALSFLFFNRYPKDEERCKDGSIVVKEAGKTYWVYKTRVGSNQVIGCFIDEEVKDDTQKQRRIHS